VTDRYAGAVFIVATTIACLIGQTLGDGAGSETVGAWVFLHDKGIDPGAETEAAFRELEQTFDPRALARRRARRTAPGLFDEHDLPVSNAYLDRIRKTGADVRLISRWLNAACIETDAAGLPELAALECVDRIEPFRRAAAEPGDLPDRHADHATRDAGFYGVAFDQADQINADALHQLGFTGEGVLVGVLDSGFSRIHEAFNEPGHPLDVLLEYDFVNNDADTSIEPTDPTDQHEHGTWILGAIGSYDPGVLVGTGYDASFILCKVEDVLGEYPAEEAMFVAGLEMIENNGGDVATSSVVMYGVDQSQLDGQTSLMARGVNIATANGVHVLQGCGNGGHDANPATSTLLTPTDAFEVISIGSVDVNGASAWFTSDGPTADGRTKPELLARGVNTASVDVYATSGVFYQNGASMATPVAAGAVACLVQIHPEWTVQQMREALFTTATDYTANGTTDPLYIRGYGIIDALAAAYVSFCDGDLTTAGAGTGDARYGMPDGDATASDLNYFVNGWVADDHAVADVTTQGAGAGDPGYGGPDGQITAADINYFVNAWVAGCQ